MSILTILGLSAGTLTTIAYIPQLLKTWQSKSAQDLSWSMLITLWAGVILWLVYGIYNQDLPVVATNAITLVLSSTILGLKFKFEQFSPMLAKSASEPTKSIRI